MFQKSIHIDLIYTELPYEERFAAAKRDGFNAVEFYIEGWESKDLHRIKQLLDENGLVMSAATGATPYSMCNAAEREQYLAHIKKLIAAAKQIDCPILMVHTNLLDPATNYAAKVLPESCTYISKICSLYDVLKTIAPWGAEAGITFVVEPLSDAAHPGYFVHDTKTCVELIRAVNEPNVKVLYDAYHMYMEEGDISQTLDQYIGDIGHIHVADVPGRHEPGTGDINYRNILNHIASLPYDGYVAFEFYPKESSEQAVKAIHAVSDF